MRKIVFILLVSMCLVACGNKNEKENSGDNKLIEENILLDLPEENELEIEPKNEEEVLVNKADEEFMKAVEEKEQESVKQTEEKNDMKVEPVKEEIIYAEGIEAGKKAIDFEVELLTGEKVKLSNYLGKPIFLNFWATWCGPCVGEMPDIEMIKNEYGDELVVLLINGGESKNDVQSFIDKKGYTFNVGLDERGEILTKYDSMYIPLSIFIDENGIIQERKVGALSEENMKRIIEDIIIK